MVLSFSGNFSGTSAVFFAYGMFSLLILGVFVFVNFYRRDGGFQPDLPPEEDPHQMADEGAALAPHGVPSNLMPRAASTQHLDKNEAGSYGACTTNGMLDVQGKSSFTLDNFDEVHEPVYFFLKYCYQPQFYLSDEDKLLYLFVKISYCVFA